jgi:flagellar biosynthetic protein FliP
MRKALLGSLAFVAASAAALVMMAGPALAQTTTSTTSQPAAQVNLDLGGTGTGNVPSQSVVIILLLTLLSVAPALLIMLTSFTRVVVVLSLTRNALGLQAIPPNQVVVGLALFLSLFLMAPTLSEMNENALQPYLKGTKSQSVAFADAQKPLKTFMLKQVRSKELAMFVNASGEKRPARAQDVSMTALIPAFILSELKTAFIIGFIIFVPFLVVDLVVSSSLMSMGMMMLPPVLISLPFKLLLFVMVDGWALVVRSLLASFK